MNYQPVPNYFPQKCGMDLNEPYFDGLKFLSKARADQYSVSWGKEFYWMLLLANPQSGTYDEMNVIFSDSTRHPDALSIRLIEYSMNRTTGITSEENNAGAGGSDWE